jgi:cell pole-organizing protein PopZ
LEQGGLMSPINSNSSERDFETLHRAQRAHEPSMEEILASIRNIIADDPAQRTAPNAAQPAPTPTPQIVYSKEAAAPHGGTAGSSQRQDANAPTVVWRRPQAAEAEPAGGALQPSEGPLLSPQASEAAALSFGALSAGLEARSAELADSMMRDMLRPMLKSWLDDNLPAIVERLVREEIQRVARGSR